MRAALPWRRHVSAPERMAQSVRHRAQPGRAALLLLTRLAALVLALLPLLAPAVSSAHASTARLAHVAASAHLAASGTTPLRGTTPIPPGCAERSPSAASASTALGGIDSASAPRARALAMGGRPSAPRASPGDGGQAQRPAREPWRWGAGPAGQPEHLGPRRTNVSAYKAFRYDADGELVETIDRGRGRTQFRYDPVGQLLAMVSERARAELFRYDKTGNLHEDGARADRRIGGAPGLPGRIAPATGILQLHSQRNRPSWGAV